MLGFWGADKFQQKNPKPKPTNQPNKKVFVAIFPMKIPLIEYRRIFSPSLISMAQHTKMLWMCIHGVKKSRKTNPKTQIQSYSLTNFSSIARVQLRAEFDLQSAGFPRLPWSCVNQKCIGISGSSGVKPESGKAQSEPEVQRKIEVNKRTHQRVTKPIRFA